MAKGSAMAKGRAMERGKKKLERVLVANEKERWKRGVTIEGRKRWQKRACNGRREKTMKKGKKKLEKVMVAKGREQW